MPSRTRPLRDLPVLPEDPTDKAFLRIETISEDGRSLKLGMAVPGADTVACATIAGAIVIGVGGPAATIYATHAADFPPGWAACIACVQMLGSVVLGLRARRSQVR